MRRARCAILLASLAIARATVHGAAQETPRFTLAEETIIARNEALSALLATNPRGVRRIIDAMAAAKQSRSGKVKGRKRDVGEPRTGAGAVQIDPLRNPDLVIFQRASPEAAYDLFQLLKRVGNGK
jgi:hypothetical protein